MLTPQKSSANVYRCLLISQDGDELYITKAYALDKYIANQIDLPGERSEKANQAEI
jgi:hypothetical protein